MHHSFWQLEQRLRQKSHDNREKGLCHRCWIAAGWRNSGALRKWAIRWTTRHPYPQYFCFVVHWICSLVIYLFDLILLLFDATGEFDVIQKLNGSGDFQLYLSYGQWGQAWLSLLPGEESYNYLLVWDSDIVQEFYATDPSSEIIAVYDRVVRSITFLENGYPTGTYLRDQYLDDLPTTPWEAGSCGQQTIWKISRATKVKC